MPIRKSEASQKEFQAVWNAIQRMKTFTLEQVSDKTGIPVRPRLYKIISSMKDQDMVAVHSEIIPRLYKAIIPVVTQADIESDVEVQRGRDAQIVWDHIRHLQTFILKDVETATGLSAVKHLHLIMGRMEASGVVRINRKTKPYQYTMIASDAPINCPDLKDAGRKRKQTSHDRMWSCLKILKQFTSTDLALYASASKSSAKSYARKLHQAGYLKKITTSNGGEAFIFDKAKNSGRVSPAIYTNGNVYDRNLKKTVWTKSGGQS